MSTRRQHHTDGAIFFCTFTCWNWLDLIAMTNSHDRLYDWMHRITAKGCSVLGYVIMPNHVHLLLHTPAGLSVNRLLGEGKRSTAHAIGQRLERQGELSVLKRLRDAVRLSEAVRGQRHRIFSASTDIRECFNEAMVQQKLAYIHANPLGKHWALAPSAADYPHSSAAFYERGATGPAPLRHYHDIVHPSSSDAADRSAA